MNQAIKSAILASFYCGLSAQCQSSTEPIRPFLVALEVPNKPVRRFVPEAAPMFDPAKVGQVLSPSGITFAGVGSPKPKVVSKDEVLRQLRERKGEVFRTFAHLGFLLSHPKPQYSTVHCTKKGDRLIATLATWYKLTFQSTQSGISLLEIEDQNAGE